MPLQKKFDSAPYYDDYSESKDYYKILFKPGVAVQARELNQLQTMLQKQIERFGDHVFKSGTIVSGVNFTYNAALDYVKILDVESDGRPVAPGSYVGLFARNTSNLVATVVSSKDGYESRDPDLNTLYLTYINSGNTYTETTFSNSALLTIYSPTYPLYGITIDSPGADFANSDDVVITSAVKVLLLSNTKFQNTEVITQATSGATLEIVEAIDDASNTEMQILRVKPRNSDLANTSESSSKWSLQTSLNIVGGTSTATARVTDIIGSGARGIATTDSLGIVRVITVASSGSGYTYVPHVTIRPSAVPTADLGNLDLIARNYKAKVTVAGSGFTSPVGQAYSFGVTEGVIYQKGYFSRVSPQTIIVSNYTNQPDGLVVGFTTDESNVGVTSDSSLYDNAANTTNYRAPGADRLKLYPTLKVIANTAAKANTTFFPLVEFQDGQASREYRDTQYNVLAQEFERRTKESAGDYVIDPFIVTTKEITGNTTHFSALIDPGTAYIDGARVKTINNTYIPVSKVSETAVRQNTILTASYGNFVRVNELIGNFDFKTGATVDLYNTAVAAATNTTPPTTGGGTKIGTARVRSLVHEIGDQGLPSCLYKMYLFDIQMTQGNTFENVRSIHYNGTNKGLCDTVLRYNTTANRNGAVLEDTTLSDSVFDLGITGVKSISNVSYRYRTSNESLTVATNGTFSISAPSGYEFPYTAGHTLSSSEKQTFTFTPLETLVGSANVSGTFNVSSTSAVISTSASQQAVLAPGDYIGVYSAPSTYDTRRVVSVNATAIVVSANLSFTNTAASATIVLPAYVPVNLSKSTRTIATRPGAGGNATVDIDFGSSFVASKSVVGAYNIYIPSATRVSKTVNRNVRVKINTSTHTNGAAGPWSLGVPDVIRLRAVYEGTTTSGTEVTKHFFIDDGGKGDAYKLGALVKDPLSSYSTTGKNLLVVFDCFTPSSGLEGFYSINSYPVNDTANLASSNTTINSLEIPELVTTRGYYYDLRNGLDFRPVGANTATLATTDGTANTNPSGTFTLNTDEKFFPVPDSEISFDSEIYQARSDTIVVRKDGDFGVLEGAARDSADQRYAPKNEARSMVLNNLLIPKYPALPQVLSAQTRTFINKSVGNERGIVSKRASAYRIQTTLNGQVGMAVQPKGFTMSRIGSLERRVQVLEQYVSLSRRESAVKDIAIASSIDPTKQRFKNGFIVDNFDKTTSADRTNKEFNAIVDGSLKPAAIAKTLNMRIVSGDTVASNGIFNDALMLPHTEEALVSFVVGTVPYVAPTPSSSPIPITPSPSISRIPASSSTIPDSPNPSPTPTPSITPTSTPSPSITPTASPTPSPSATPGISITPTPSPSITPTPTPTATATPSPTPTPTATATPSPSITPSPTPSVSPPYSPVPGSPAPTPSPTPTATPSPTPTISITPTPSPTPSPSETPPITPTPTPSPSVTPPVTPTPSPTPSETPPVTPTPSPTISITPSPTPSPSRSVPVTPTPSPTATNTPIPPPASPSNSPPASVAPSASMPAGRSTGGGGGGGDYSWWIWSPGIFISYTTWWTDLTDLTQTAVDDPEVYNPSTTTTPTVEWYDDPYTIETTTDTTTDTTTIQVDPGDFGGDPDIGIYDITTGGNDAFTAADPGDFGGFGGGGGGCPDPATPIMISPTDSVQAGTLKVGDIIYTMHETTGEYGYFKVNGAEEVQQPKLQFNMVDGTSLIVSTTHRFLTPTGAYEYAGNIKVGDMLKKVDTEVAVASIDSVGTGSVIKFEIDQAHTYIAGGFIAHNTKMIESYWDFMEF